MKPANHLIRLLAVAALVISSAASASIAERAVRTKMAGIDVIVYPTEVRDVVTVSGSLPGGDAFAARGHAAVPSLVGMMLDKGTRRQDKFEISRKLQRVGAQISFGVDTQMVTISGRSLRKDVPLLIDLIAEQLRMPAFLPDEFTKVKSQYIARLRRALDDTGARANDVLIHAVFAEGHPNHTPAIEEYMADAPGTTLEEVKEFHRQHYGPAHMTLVFVGDVDVEQIRAQVGEAFTEWSGGVDVMRAGRAATPQGRELTVSVAGKTSVSVLLGAASGMTYRDPDAQALRVATAILGSGFTGRLMSTVRVKEGLTYGIGAGLDSDTFTDGVWRISATFAPALVDQGLASTRRELQKWWEHGVTAQELAARKTNMIGSFQVGLATTAGMAAMLLRAAQLGYEVSWLDDYPHIIESLTLEQVNGAIRRHLDPDKMVVVKSGTLARPPDA